MYFPSKPDASLSPVTMLKSHEKKSQNYFRSMVKCRRNVSYEEIDTERFQQGEMMEADFDYCEENLRSLSNTILLLHC